MSFNLPDGLSKSDRIHMGIDIEPDDDYDWEGPEEDEETITYKNQRRENANL